MNDSADCVSVSRAGAGVISHEIDRLQREVEFLNERVSFWRSQATAAQRRKAELYSLLLELRRQIDQAFGGDSDLWRRD